MTILPCPISLELYAGHHQKPGKFAVVWSRENPPYAGGALHLLVSRPHWVWGYSNRLLSLRQWGIGPLFLLVTYPGLGKSGIA